MAKYFFGDAKIMNSVIIEKCATLLENIVDSLPPQLHRVTWESYVDDFRFLFEEDKVTTRIMDNFVKFYIEQTNKDQINYQLIVDTIDEAIIILNETFEIYFCYDAAEIYLKRLKKPISDLYQASMPIITFDSYSQGVRKLWVSDKTVSDIDDFIRCYIEVTAEGNNGLTLIPKIDELLTKIAVYTQSVRRIF